MKMNPRMLAYVLASALLRAALGWASEVGPPQQVLTAVFATNFPGGKVAMELVAPCRAIAGTALHVEGRIRNDSNHGVMIYMPGLSLFPRVRALSKSGSRGRPDEFGLPLTYGRRKSANAVHDYVFLEPGDSYCRRFTVRELNAHFALVNFELTYEEPSKKRGGNLIQVACITSVDIAVSK